MRSTHVGGVDSTLRFSLTGSNIKRRVGRIAPLAVIAAVAINGMAIASPDNWTSTAGGNWETGTNWNTGTPPAILTSDAYFNTGSGTPYAVTLPGAEKTNNLYVQGDSVTFNTSGASSNSIENLEMNLGLYVTAGTGQTSSLTLLGNSSEYGIETDNGSFSIGATGTGTAYFTDNGVRLTDGSGNFVFGPGSVVSVTNTYLRGSTSGVGMIVQGTANVSTSLGGVVVVGGPGPGGAVLNGNIGTPCAAMNVGSGGIGTANAGFQLSGTLNIGVDSQGTVNNAGGSDSAEYINIGTAGAPGVFNVSAGTVNAIQLTVGANGSLNMSSGTLLTAGTMNFAHGSINITGATLVLNGPSIIDPALTVPATTTLQATNGLQRANTNVVMGNLINAGTVQALTGNDSFSVTGSFNQSAGGLLEIPIETDSGTSYETGALFSVLGSSTLGGTLDVTASPDFPITDGESFQILSLASETGTFSSIELPPLAGGLYWNTSTLYTNGTITAVPEPGSLAFIVTALGVLIRPRHRNRIAEAR
jgi:hypothetical protein